MRSINLLGILLIVLSFVLVFSGCDRLKALDQKVGEAFFSEEPLAESVAPVITKKVSAKDLSKEQKLEIDTWLEENGFNRYGDDIGTMYTGGTPLFDEATGERLDRFDYILKIHPDILQKI